MKTHASTDLIGGRAGDFYLGWDETRCWLKRVLCGEGAASAAVWLGSSVASLGGVAFVQYKLFEALLNWTGGGVGVSLFAFF